MLLKKFRFEAKLSKTETRFRFKAKLSETETVSLRFAKPQKKVLLRLALYVSLHFAKKAFRFGRFDNKKVSRFKSFALETVSREINSESGAKIKWR